MNTRRICLIATLLLVARPALAAGPGSDDLAHLDRLARFKDSIEVGSVSSYDRTGGNDDGFSGKYSFLRREGNGLVLADLEGPGIVYRITTPTPTDDTLELYFDGETAPRMSLPFVDLFTGKREPFLSPLVGFGGGGFYSYVPLPYRKACKIVIRPAAGRTESKMQFYQINYAKYPPAMNLATFSLTPSPADAASLARARKIVSMTGSDIAEYIAPEGSQTNRNRTSGRLEAGKPSTLLDVKQGGRVVGLRLGPARALGGKDRAVLLRMFWDDDPLPAVAAPVSDFFGYSWGEPASRGLILGTNDDVNYLYFPMPFDRSARIELVNEAPDAAPIDFEAEIVTADVPRTSDEGRFYAAWHRENPTTPGVPFTFVDIKGRGHIVAALLQAQGFDPGNTEFFEGDDQATLDGQLTVHGTGSEDAFNGGWYDVPGRWDARVSFPFSGSLDYKKHLGRTGAYRFFLGDAYAFRQSARFTIEHGPEENRIPTDYVGVTFLYADRRPEGLPDLPALTARRVIDPARVVFAAGWSTPIQAFSFQSATLTRKEEKLGEKNIRYLSMRATGEDIFGPHFLSLGCELPQAGRYKVSIEVLKGPEQAVVQLVRNERPVGDRADLYAVEPSVSTLIPMGSLDMREGLNTVLFKLVDKNAQATALGFDLMRIVLEREP